MKYAEPRKLSQAEAEQIFESAEPPLLCETLVSVALNESDWRWVQAKCLAFTSHADFRVRSIAATCLGHLARIHRQLDLDRVMPRLEMLLLDPQTAGYAENAIDDIETFMRSSARNC